MEVFVGYSQKIRVSEMLCLSTILYLCLFWRHGIAFSGGKKLSHASSFWLFLDHITFIFFSSRPPCIFTWGQLLLNYLIDHSLLLSCPLPKYQFICSHENGPMLWADEHSAKDVAGWSDVQSSSQSFDQSCPIWQPHVTIEFVKCGKSTDS